MAATRDYTLGKGKMLFKKDGEDFYRDLGNAPAFTLNITIDKLEHYSSRAGISVKDLEVITQLTAGGSFTLDEANGDNLSMFVMSTGATDNDQVAAVAADLADEDGNTGVLIPIHSLGSWIPLYTAAGERAINLSGVTVTEETPTTLEEGIEGVGNYQLDLTAGLIWINADQSGATTPLTTANTLGVNGAVADQARSETSGGTLTTLKGNVLFVGAPPQGRILDVTGYCSLTPNGDWSLIGEDWMQYTFDIEFLEVAGVSGVVHVVDRGKVG